MLPAVQIPVGVSVQDCLSWSSDGELAIASGERVYILIPNQDGHEPWKHISFRIDTFGFDDWPWPTQASFKDMSIGEEQARVTVTALEWSPPGLAKYRRSVLAVLTSNLLLSLWAPGGDVRDPKSWERVLIVNWTFTPPTISIFHDGRRPLQRIRSMAWAPTCPHHTADPTPFSTRKWGIHLLAITDDDNGVYFLSISSPAVSASVPWDTETLLYKEIQPDLRANIRPSLLNLSLNARHFIDRVEFGTWISPGELLVICHSSGTAHHATLAVSAGSPLRVKLSDEATNVLYVETPNDQVAGVRSRSIQIDDQREQYNARNALDSHVFTRSWGTASFHGIIATCISLHPSNSFEFLDPSDGSAVVLFDIGKNTDHDQDTFPWQVSTKVDESKTYGIILDSVLDGPLLRSLDLTGSDFMIIYTAVCAAVLVHDTQRQQRLQAAEGLLYLLQFKTETKFQAELEMVASCRNGPQASDQDLVNLVGNTTKKRGQQSSESNPQDILLLATCPFCPSDHPQRIAFESMTEAHCPQGHPFSTSSARVPTGCWLITPAARCALTLLPILEPGSSKRCTGCDRTFLNEQLHSGIMQSISASAPESKPSLAAVLFDRFDTCVYCGGKFQD